LSVERNAEGVAYLTARLRELGFRVVPTTAIFIYLETAENPTDLGRRVQNEGCIIRSLAPWGIPNALRITAGTPEQNKTLIEALKRVLQRVPTGL
jgi:histidinol-phosphate aminotransferase